MADGGANGPGAPPARRFHDVRRYAEVDSTNRVVADLARSGAPDGVVVVADHQTAGRGRRGRSWVAPAGSSLLVSVLVRTDAGPAPLATIAASLAVSDAIEAAAGFRPVLRWPNDVYVAGRKLGGILAEVVDPTAVVVGAGVNLRWPSGVPEELAPIAVAAEEVAGRGVDREDLLGALLDALDARLGRDDRSTLADYRARCETLGRPVRVALPGGRVLTGTATGVDGGGRLLVAADGTEHALSAGDVEHVDRST